MEFPRKHRIFMGLGLALATTLAALASADDRADASATLKELEAVPAG